MPVIAKEIIDEIRDRVDLVQLISRQTTLQRKGKSYLGLCPFHQEKTPSFNVNPEIRSFYCFGCQTGGDAFSFVQKTQNVSFIEAVEILAEMVGVNLPAVTLSSEDDATLRQKRRLYDVCQEANSFFRQQYRSHPEAIKARRYATQRDLSEETIELFQIGYAPSEWRGLADHLSYAGFGIDIMEQAGLVVRSAREGGQAHHYDRFRGRLMFPIFDYRGRCIAFGGRILDDEPNQPKYLNSPQTDLFNKGQTLYGIHLHRGKKPKEIVVYEGYMDLIATWQAGLHNGVASLGTALTEEHCQLIKRYSDTAILCFDADRAGIAAAQRGMFLLDKFNLTVKVASVPEGKDPDEYLRHHNVADFEGEVLKKALPFLRYCKENLKQSYNLNTIEGKSGFVREFLDILIRVANPIEEEEYLREVASELSLTMESLRREELNLQRRKKMQDRQQVAYRNDLSNRLQASEEGTVSVAVEKDKTQNGNELPVELLGIYKAEEILLALALFDTHLALKLTEQWSCEQFKNDLHRQFALEVWHFMQKGVSPELNDITEDGRFKALEAKFSFLIAGLDNRELSFSQSLNFLKIAQIKEEIERLTLYSETLQQDMSSNNVEFLTTLQRLQELQVQMLNIRHNRY